MIFYRFGEIPKNEKSCIWKGEEKIGEELGVSVYEAHKNINGTYSPVLPFPTNEKAFNSFTYYIAYFNGNKYLVTGNLLNETGTDGEPLINNVKIIKKIMTQKERYNKICELVDITDEIRDKLWNIVYEPQEGDFKNHFDNLHKAEKVAIIGILNDASRLASSIANYQHWFEEK